MENDGRNESTDSFRERKRRQMQAANEELVKRRAQHNTTAPEKQTRRDTAQPGREIKQTHFQVSGLTGVFQHVDVKGSGLHTSIFGPMASCADKSWQVAYIPNCDET